MFVDVLKKVSGRNHCEKNLRMVLLEVGYFVIGLFVQKKTACYLLVRLGGGFKYFVFIPTW